MLLEQREKVESSDWFSAYGFRGLPEVCGGETITEVANFFTVILYKVFFPLNPAPCSQMSTRLEEVESIVTLNRDIILHIVSNQPIFSCWRFSILSPEHLSCEIQSISWRTGLLSCSFSRCPCSWSTPKAMADCWIKTLRIFTHWDSLTKAGLCSTSFLFT
ncbi:hypothetical protein PoB_000930000 [Plakobranchus ocellatus]|uniref:Uncharacterized protein n=1 Tax=Plakobranchus ocellatus TaxID=259542 RepID=A0AAV3YJX2_9GAST|nr:hypothetical protein PoB_000930000 [Plakobranchus ocellatus]